MFEHISKFVLKLRLRACSTEIGAEKEFVGLNAIYLATKWYDLDEKYASWYIFNVIVFEKNDFKNFYFSFL